MKKMTLTITGMVCGMCESHINDTIRKAFTIKKVTSSHKRNETIIITENELDHEKLKEVIANTGYELQSITTEPYISKGIFARFSS